MEDRFTPTYKEISVKEWMWTLILLYIPVVNVIFCLYWAFSSEANPSKKNLCRAIVYLVLLGIITLSVVFGISYLSSHAFLHS